MTVPRLKGSRPSPVASSTPAFWGAAQLCDAQIGNRTFDGRIAQFGFVRCRLDDVLDTIKNAMNDMHKLLPWDHYPLNTLKDGETYYQYVLRMWKASARHVFWLHPDEPTYAVTSDHHFSRPYGDESATLMNFAAPVGNDETRQRQQDLLSLEAAKHAARKHPQLYRHDTFNALSDGVAGTYRFAKSSSTTGRDRVDNQSSGVSLPENGPKLLDAPGAPFLYLHLSSAYMAA